MGSRSQKSSESLWMRTRESRIQCSESRELEQDALYSILWYYMDIVSLNEPPLCHCVRGMKEYVMNVGVCSSRYIKRIISFFLNPHFIALLLTHNHCFYKTHLIPVYLLREGLKMSGGLTVTDGVHYKELPTSGLPFKRNSEWPPRDGCKWLWMFHYGHL